MSKLVVDKLPDNCLECPLLGYAYPPQHSCRNSWRSCPLKENYPDCLERFVELKEIINARTKKPTAVELLSRSEGKACGECKFFTDENTDGEGLCILLKMPFVKYCGNKACTWFKERMKVI